MKRVVKRIFTIEVDGAETVEDAIDIMLVERLKECVEMQLNLGRNMPKFSASYTARIVPAMRYVIAHFVHPSSPDYLDEEWMDKNYPAKVA